MIKTFLVTFILAIAGFAVIAGISLAMVKLTERFGDVPTIVGFLVVLSLILATAITKAVYRE